MKPVRFSFVLHMHQPVGNFDSVFREHAVEVYLPLLKRLIDGHMLPLGLHVSGPLLAWLAREEPKFVDLIRREVEAGTIELLTSGLYEPVLAALSPADRTYQLEGMAALLHSHFGVKSSTIWLTERVWEGTIVPQLAEAGVRTVLVDDWHFRVSGFRPDQLVRPFRTEVDGAVLNVLPISEKMRYLIPFAEADRVRDHLRDLAEREVPFALFGDDGEKFGGWPRTHDWVWESGWIHRFVDVVADAAERGWIELVTPSQSVELVASGGLAYLGSASYSEMEEWTLPPELSTVYRDLRDRVAEDHDLDGPADPKARVRGSHWRNFLVRYPEANRLHKKAFNLAKLARSRGAVPATMDAIARAQSNDPLWHGVFGGIYMKHLRDAAWRSLAVAEQTLRAGQALQHEQVDLDLDGHDEVWIHSDRFSAVVSPGRGGALEELTLFASGTNEADVLTRYREAYHSPAVERWQEWVRQNEDTATPPGAADENRETEGSASIHDLETAYMLESLPPADTCPRSLVVEHVLPAGVGASALEAGQVQPLWRSAVALGEREVTFRARVADAEGDECVEVVVEAQLAHVEGEPIGTVSKVFTFDRSGLRAVSYTWPTDCFPRGSLWTVEVSQNSATCPQAEGAILGYYPVVSAPRSERGFERIQQGHAYVMQWPIEVGEARLVWR